MRKIIFIILSFFALIFILLLTIFFIVKSYLTPERIKEFTQKTLSDALKKDVKIEKVEPQISLRKIGISAKRIKVKEDEKRDFLDVEKIEFSLRILPLIFKRTLEIDGIYIKNPSLFLYQKEEFPVKKPEKEKEAQKIEIPVFFILKSLEIEKARIEIVPLKGKRIAIYPFNLKISSKSITRNTFEFKGNGDVSLKDFEFFSPIKYSFNLNFDLTKDKLEIKNYDIKVKDINLNGKGEILKVLVGEPEYKISLESKNIPLTFVKEILKVKEIDLSGNLDVLITVSGNYKDIIPDIKGKIDGKSLYVKTPLRKVDFTKFFIEFKGKRGELNLDFASEKQKGNLNIEFSLLFPNEFSGKGKINGDLFEFTGKSLNYSLDFNAKGSAKGNLDISGKFYAGKNDLIFNLNGETKGKITFLKGSLNSSNLNLNEILPEEKKTGEGKKEIKKPELILPENIRIFIEGNIRNFVYKEDNLKDIKVEIEIDERGIRIKNLKGKVYGGEIEGNIEITKGSILVKSNLKGKNLEFSEILKNHKFYLGEIKGKLNIETDSKFDLDDIFGTLYASNTVIAFDGEFKKDPILDKIAEILKIEELKNLKFKNINLKIKIEKGFIDFPDFKIDASDYFLEPKGRASLKGDLDFDILFKFRGKGAELLRKYSALSNYFTDKSGDFELFFKIKGTHKNPSISLNTQKFEEKIKEELKKKGKEKLEEGVKKGLEELKKKFGF
ncbi:MAG: AsmA-like C-terminal region-containing protein [candidate division WOR-3 bacterium]